MTPRGIDFGEVLIWLKAGKKLARENWNGRGMWIELQIPTETSKMTRPYIYMTLPKGSTKQFGTQEKEFELIPWLPSNTDILAEDWFVVEN